MGASSSQKGVLPLLQEKAAASGEMYSRTPRALASRPTARYPLRAPGLQRRHPPLCHRLLSADAGCRGGMCACTTSSSQSLCRVLVDCMGSKQQTRWGCSLRGAGDGAQRSTALEKMILELDVLCSKGRKAAMQR